MGTASRRHLALTLGSGGRTLRATCILPGLLLGLAACSNPAAPDPCEPIDPVLADSSFVVVVNPTAGVRASSPLQVRGCSRTFESNVVWELRSRDGRPLASGHTSGGGVSGAEAFSFSAAFTVSAPELGHLEVFEPDESDGEGFPPGRSLIPLILLPSPE
jgi:hypothetical protein